MIKTYVIGALQLLIVFLSSVFVESVSNGELLFTEGILADGLRKSIISHPIMVLVILGISNLGLYIFSHRDKNKHLYKKFYNNICELVFDQYIKPDNELENSEFRVSLFKAKKGIIWRKKKLLPEITTYLVNVGRYQTRQQKKMCKIKFLPGEGIVGHSYNFGVVLYQDFPKFSNGNEEKYEAMHEEKYSLPKHKTRKLRLKCGSYLGCPIKFFKSDDIFGIIMVDSVSPKKLKKERFRTIENVVENYSVFFHTN